jgi:hypothetical protein
VAVGSNPIIRPIFVRVHGKIVNPVYLLCCAPSLVAEILAEYA